MREPIFIGGTGRSGTTVVKRVLQRHPQVVAVARELHLVSDPGGALDLVLALSDRWSPFQADAALKQFRTLVRQCAHSSRLVRAETRAVRALGISPRRYWLLDHARDFGGAFYFRRLEQLIDEVTLHKTRGSWYGTPSYSRHSVIYETRAMARAEAAHAVRRFFDDLYGHIARDGQTHWLDSTPDYLSHAHEVLELFPAGKFIHVYRDPRDVMASYRKRPWGGDDYVAIAQRLAHLFERWSAVRARLPEGRCVEVGLEALAEDPARGFEQLCAFIGLAPAALPVEQVDRRRMHAGHWRDEVPAAQAAQAQSILQPVLKAYGYEA
jgi:hypothetical protein